MFVFINILALLLNFINYSFEVSVFELRSNYCFLFLTNTLWKGIERSYPASYGLNSTTVFFLFVHGFGVK